MLKWKIFVALYIGMGLRFRGQKWHLSWSIFYMSIRGCLHDSRLSFFREWTQSVSIKNPLSVYMIPDWVSFQNELNPFLLKNPLSVYMIPEWDVTHSGIGSLRFSLPIEISFRIEMSFWRHVKAVRVSFGSKLIDQLHKLFLSRSNMFLPVLYQSLIFSRHESVLASLKTVFRRRIIIGLLAYACLVLYCSKYRCCSQWFSFSWCVLFDKLTI